MVDFAHERRLDGLVAGIDEVGRGPLAGPVVAAALSIVWTVIRICETRTVQRWLRWP